MKSIMIFFMILFFVGVSWAEDSLESPGFAFVELYVSESCSSCPPSENFLNPLVVQSRQQNWPLYILYYHVDYWNHLYWVDPYSHRFFSKRQREYSGVLRRSSVYTPQAIVNGQVDVSGNDHERLKKTIDSFLRQSTDAAIVLDVKQSEESVFIEYALNKEFDGYALNVVLAEGGIERKITNGENKGAVLKHESSVRYFNTIDLGQDQKGNLAVAFPEQMDVYQTALIVFLQDPQSKEILAAARYVFKK